MARTITWTEPVEDTITKVHIERSATLHGVYTEIADIDATSDGLAKSAANTWVVQYLDTAGTRTDWYRVRFYDGNTTLFSDYSDPITAEELISLCSTTDVKGVIKTVGRFTDDEIFAAIQEVEEEIYEEMGTPMTNILTEVGKIDDDIQYTYYVGQQNIYRVDRVFYGTTTKTELFLDDAYKTNLKYGMIRVLPVASTGPELAVNCDLEISYVPSLMHRYALFKSCEFLLEQIDYINKGTVSKELATIQNKLARVEQRLQYQYGFGVSSQFENYSKVYPNKNRIRQKFNENKYLAQYGW